MKKEDDEVVVGFGGWILFLHKKAIFAHGREIMRSSPPPEAKGPEHLKLR